MRLTVSRLVVDRGYNRSIVEKSAERALFDADDILALFEHELEQFWADIAATKC